MKKRFCQGLFFVTLSTTFLFATAAFAEDETPAPVAEQQIPEQESQDAAQEQLRETLEKTTHGRSMLSRDDGGDAESGRFMRALSACIRYYTGSSN